MTPNRKMVSNKHVKDLKIRLFLVYDKAQICFQVRLKVCAKMGNKKGKGVTFVAKRGQQPLGPRKQSFSL